jgi:hypothetical protein
VESGFPSGHAEKQKNKACPGKVESGFPPGHAEKQKNKACPGKGESGFPSGHAEKSVARKKGLADSAIRRNGRCGQDVLAQSRVALALAWRQEH